MRAFASICVLVTLILAGVAPAGAAVVARVDISNQKMHVSVNGVPTYSWDVSTAKRGYRTPVGSYRPTRMHRRYYSRRYNNAPMPHSIFFHKGYAIHGTTEVKHIGRPASRGCIRLHPANAATLFALVQAHGPSNTRIELGW